MKSKSSCYKTINIDKKGESLFYKILRLVAKSPRFCDKTVGIVYNFSQSLPKTAGCCAKFHRQCMKPIWTYSDRNIRSVSLALIVNFRL